MDTLYVEPQGSGIYALQTWEIFGDKWKKSFNKRHYACSVIFELEGTATSACTDCDASWSTTSTFLESDCEDWFIAEASFPVTTGVGVGEVATSIAADVPYPGNTIGGRIAYDDQEFLDHGWAYPEALDQNVPVEDTSWDGEQPFVLWPAWVWEIRQDVMAR